VNGEDMLEMAESADLAPCLLARIVLEELVLGTRVAEVARIADRSFASESRRLREK
jgi:hypothetical protein